MRNKYALAAEGYPFIGALESSRGSGFFLEGCLFWARLLTFLLVYFFRQPNGRITSSRGRRNTCPCPGGRGDNYLGSALESHLMRK